MQIVATHKGTDFDALASLIAGSILYPGAIPVLPRNVNPNVKAFVSIHKDLLNLYSPTEIDLNEVDRLIVVDTGNWNRLDGLNDLKNKKDLEIILWDHHVSGDIKPDWKCQEEVGSTITLMVRQLKKERKVITPIQATLFLAGLYEDTGNLSFSSCKPEDAYAAAYLLERKADLAILSSFLRPAYGEKQKDILFEMLSDTQPLKINGYQVAFKHVEITGHMGGLSVVVSMFREILNVDAAFGLFVDPERDRCIVIGRSHIESLNIGSIMRSLGGGGHPGAGSAMVKSGKPEAIQDLITELISGNQQSSVQLSDLMSYPVQSVPSDLPMDEMEKILQEKGCTGMPVIENGKMVGIISRRDFRKIRKQKHMKSPVKAFMSPEVISISPEKSPMEAARMMIKHDIGRIPVVQDGELIGIVTRSDAMLFFYDLLPD